MANWFEMRRVHNDIESLAYRLAHVRWHDTDDSGVRDQVVNVLFREWGNLSAEDAMIYRHLAQPTFMGLTSDVAELLKKVNWQVWRNIFPIYNESGEVTKRVQSLAAEVLRLKGVVVK